MMKKQSIWYLRDILDFYKNRKLDLEMDLKNSELKYCEDKLKLELSLVNQKIKELLSCIIWISNIE